MTWKISKLFVNTLTAHDKYPLLNRGILQERIQMQLSKKQKDFSELFCAFFKFTLNFKHVQTNMTLIAYVFPKLQTRKNLVR